MLIRFAGFTPCDGFPFGSDGTESVVFAFLIALISVFIFPLPYILKEQQQHKLKRQVIGLAGVIGALMLVFSGASARSEFNVICDKELQGYWAYIGSLVMPIIQAVALAAVTGLIIKYILKASVIGIKYIAVTIRK